MDALVVETNVVREAFQKAFGDAARLGCFVLPAASISSANTPITTSASSVRSRLIWHASPQWRPSTTGKLRVYSQNLDDMREWPVDELASSSTETATGATTSSASLRN